MAAGDSPVFVPEALTDEALTDEELCALALAADPEAGVDDDAVSLWDLTAPEGPDRSLPEWYMPAPTGGRLLRGWQRIPVGLVIASFLAINIAGLCNTYGQLGFG